MLSQSLNPTETNQSGADVQTLLTYLLILVYVLIFLTPSVINFNLREVLTCKGRRVSWTPVCVS